MPTHDKLRGQNDSVRLHPTKNALCNLVEKRRTSPSRVPQVSHCRGVVGEDGDRGDNDKREKVKESKFHSQQLPSIDRKRGVRRNPPPPRDGHPNQRPRRWTRSRGWGTPGPAKHPPGDDPGRATMTDLAGSDRPMESEQNRTPCPNNDGSSAEATACGGDRPERDERGRREDQRVPARKKRAAAWRTGIILLLREASLLAAGKEKP